MRLTILFVWAGLAGLGGALTGCCLSTKCDACPVGVNDVLLDFNTDSLSPAPRGFRVTELRRLYVVRYQRPGFGTPRDTLRRPIIVAPATAYARPQLSLQLLTPAAAPQLAAYNYRLVVPAAGRQYDLADLDLQTQIGTGCCACETNVRRRLTLDGQPVEADGREDAVATLQR